jgi:membrane protein implicated in regulation of membrane protease activity
MLLRASWHVFAAICIVAGFVADGPGLFETIEALGAVALITTIASDAWAIVRAEPLGFLACAVLLAQLLRRSASRPPPRRRRAKPKA